MQQKFIFAKQISVGFFHSDNDLNNKRMYILTDDQHRPYLMTPYKDGNNYINAVTVHVSTAHGTLTITE